MNTGLSQDAAYLLLILCLPPPYPIHIPSPSWSTRKEQGCYAESDMQEQCLVRRRRLVHFLNALKLRL